MAGAKNAFEHAYRERIGGRRHERSCLIAGGDECVVTESEDGAMNVVYALISMPLTFLILIFVGVEIRHRARFWAYLTQEYPNTDLNEKNKFFYIITIFCSIFISLSFTVDNIFYDTSVAFYILFWIMYNVLKDINPI